jgi:diamine N-acetyltransferase
LRNPDHFGFFLFYDMIHIRTIDPSEGEALRELAIEIYRTTFDSFNSKENMENYLAEAFNPKKVLQEFGEPGSVFMGAYDDGRMIGYLRLRANDEVQEELGERHIELQRLYVHADYQGKGVANDLMEASLNQAKQLGVEWLWLGVWEKNEKAQRFYQRWGFEKFSEHVFWMGDDAQTDWLMKKRV